MDRLKLGKVETEFFSVKGNRILKRMWIDNGLDEEMIFSSWIGQNKILMRQKVSDYVQNYLHHRTLLLSAQNDQNDEDALAEYQSKMEKDITIERKNEYYNKHVRQTLIENYKRRENHERKRVSQGISSGILPAIPGFEHILKDPVFRALEIERKMIKLSKIPLPFDEDQFHSVILPMLTPTFKAKVMKQKRSGMKDIRRGMGNASSYSNITSEENSPCSNTSGFIDDYSKSEDAKHSPPPSRRIMFEPELELQISENQDDLSTESGFEKSNEISLEECDFCGSMIHDAENFACSCISTQIWAGENVQNACSLFETASKILQVYIREHSISSEYMEEYYKTHYKIQ